MFGGICKSPYYRLYILTHPVVASPTTLSTDGKEGN